MLKFRLNSASFKVFTRVLHQKCKANNESNQISVRKAEQRHLRRLHRISLRKEKLELVGAILVPLRLAVNFAVNEAVQHTANSVKNGPYYVDQLDKVIKKVGNVGN